MSMASSVISVASSKGMVEGESVHVVAEAHPRSAREGRGDEEVRAGKQGVVGEVVLGEPALLEAEGLGEHDLVQHLGVGLVMRHAASLAVIEESHVHGALAATYRNGFTIFTVPYRRPCSKSSESNSLRP